MENRIFKNNLFPVYLARQAKQAVAVSCLGEGENTINYCCAVSLCSITSDFKNIIHILCIKVKSKVHKQ